MGVRDPQTEWMRVQIYRRMSGEQRIALAAEMFEDGVAIVRASILDHYPDINADELKQQVRRRILPRGLVLQVEQYLQDTRTRESCVSGICTGGRLLCAPVRDRGSDSQTFAL